MCVCGWVVELECNTQQNKQTAAHWLSYMAEFFLWADKDILRLWGYINYLLIKFVNKNM